MATYSNRVAFFCCVSCKDNKNIEEYAVYYCEKCQECFCRECCKLHDNLFSKHVKYDRSNMKKWPVSKELEAVLLMCEIHTNKQQDTLCKDHSQLCCSQCVSLSHRQCKKVTLKSAKKQASDVQELFDKLLINMRKLKKLQSCCESGIQDLNISYLQGQERMVQKMSNKIKSTVDKIVRSTSKKTPHFDRRKICESMHSTLCDIEKETLNETKRTMLSLQDTLMTGVETCIRHHHELKAVHELLLYSSDHNNWKLCFIASRKCIEKIKQVESYLDENYLKLECSVLNQAMKDTEEYVLKLSGLGKLVQSMKANIDIEKYLSRLSGLSHYRVRVVFSFYVFTVQGKSEYNVRIPSDSYTCYITGCCVLPGGQIVIADKWNNTVKLLNQQYQVVSHWDVDARLYDMCMITPSEVAVTVDDLYNIHEVQFITVTQGQLVTGRKFKLQHPCRGIAHHQGDLFITSGTALYKYTLSGKLVCRLHEDLSGSFTVRRCAVSPTGDRLYIINWEQNRLLTLARDGTVLAILKDLDLRGPSGLHVTPAGQVLVCGYGSSTIVQVDREGTRKLATLTTEDDGVLWQNAVFYSSITSSIIVGQLEDNNILVFRVE